jgi:regulatory protein YycI of two-component signal transduction system YycFG
MVFLLPQVTQSLFLSQIVITENVSDEYDCRSISKGQLDHSLDQNNISIRTELINSKPQFQCKNITSEDCHV